MIEVPLLAFEIAVNQMGTHPVIFLTGMALAGIHRSLREGESGQLQPSTRRAGFKGIVFCRGGVLAVAAAPSQPVFPSPDLIGTRNIALNTISVRDSSSSR
jgi:hypothetical protein